MSNFLNFMDEARMAIQLGSKYLESGNISEDKAANIKEAIVYNSLRTTIALYSSNAGKDEISKSLIETISAFEEGFKWKGFENSYAMYDQIIWLLSLGILCDIDNADFERIVKIIKRDNATDKLIAKLVNYKLPNSIQGFSSGLIKFEAGIRGKSTSAEQREIEFKNKKDALEKQRNDELSQTLNLSVAATKENFMDYNVTVRKSFWYWQWREMHCNADPLKQHVL